MNCIENVIEFLRGQDIMTLTLSQKKLITKVKSLAEQYPNDCQIMAINKDGSIVAHMPVEWLRLYPKRTLSEEQKEARRSRLKRA